MDRLGNRSGAIHVYERFAARLAKEYDVEPSVESQNLIERVRSRAAPHARLVNAREDATPAAAAAVSARARPYLGATADQDSVVPIPSPSPDLPLCLGSAGSPSGARRSLRWRLTAVVFPISLAIWTVIHFTQASTRHTQAPQRTRIMVGSFTDTMAPLESVALGQSLTAGIVARLAEVPAFDIVQQGTLRQGEIAQPSLSPEPQFLVTGNVLRSGEQVLVDAQIIDVQSGRTIGTATAEQDSGSAVSMVDQISQHLALMVRTVAGREVQLREWSATTKSIAARDLLGSAMADRDRARRLQRPPTMRAAIKALQDADSLLAEVEVLVPREKEPIIERARVLEQLGIFLWAPSIHDSVAVKIALRRAVTEARRALSMDTTDASALEALGSASYWYWLTIPLAPDSARRVLTNAEQSLRRAVEIDPDHASAWNLLSTALYLRADFAGAYLAADKAYAADAYLENARGILGMLFITSYEIGDDSASDHWCNEMNRLFTHTWSSAWCRLSLLAWNESHGAVAIAQAWRIATEEEREPATPRRARAALQILVAAVLARSDLRDSAEAVLLRARQEGGPDSELLPVEATARIAMNEPDSAIQLLARYVGEAPAHRMGILRSRRFVSLGALDRHIMHATDCATCRKTAKEQRVPPQ